MAINYDEQEDFDGPYYDDFVSTDDPHYEDFDADQEYEPEEDYDHWHE